ncbi:hypothetical protein N9A28_01285 [Sulfurimonas sp.]|nr:hypothetical protein [Sulfurimonas sp.]
MKSLLSVLMFFVFISGAFANEEEKDKSVDYGKIDGLIRLYHVFAPAYIKSGRAEDYAVDGSVIGGHLRYTTPTVFDFGATVAVYYAASTGFNNKDDTNTLMAAGRFFTSDYDSKAVVGELNLHFKNDDHYGIIGHFKLDTPITNAIFTYMPNMYEAVLYKNSQLDSTDITVAHVEKMAYGSRAPVEFGLIGEATRTAGTTQNALEKRGTFSDIEKQTLADDTAQTNGLTVLGVEHKVNENLNVNVWDFYAYDIINMFYADVIYKNKVNDLPYSLSAQYLRVDSVGRNLASAWLDANTADMYGLKATLKYGKSFFYAAYNHSGGAKLLNPWSGDPAYTSSFFSKNAYRANVDAYKLGFNYDILKNLKLITSHAEYGKSSTLGSFVASKPVEAVRAPENDAFESVLLLKYNPIKNLTILTGLIYKESEYFYGGQTVEVLDVDLVVTYKF